MGKAWNFIKYTGATLFLTVSVAYATHANYAGIEGYVKPALKGAVKKLKEADKSIEDRLPGPVKGANDEIRKAAGKEPRYESR